MHLKRGEQREQILLKYCETSEHFYLDVVNWSVSNSMDADWCRTCLVEAMGFQGKPEIINTDQGSQALFICLHLLDTSNQHPATAGVPHFLHGGCGETYLPVALLLPHTFRPVSRYPVPG